MITVSMKAVCERIVRLGIWIDIEQSISARIKFASSFVDMLQLMKRSDIAVANEMSGLMH